MTTEKMNVHRALTELKTMMHALRRRSEMPSFA